MAHFTIRFHTGSTIHCHPTQLSILIDLSFPIQKLGQQLSVEFELLLCKIVMHTFSLIITHVSLLLIEIFLVMATSGLRARPER